MFLPSRQQNGSIRGVLHNISLRSTLRSLPQTSILPQKRFKSGGKPDRRPHLPKETKPPSKHIRVSTEQRNPPPRSSPAVPASRARRKEDEVEKELHPLQEIYFDLWNWRESKYLLTIFVNSAAFLVFCAWVREAHLSAKAKVADKANNPPSTSNSNSDKDKGTEGVVAGNIKDTRYITPGQEGLLDNFTVTPLNLHEGRYYTLITSIFSHQLPTHIAINMLASHF